MKPFTWLRKTRPAIGLKVLPLLFKSRTLIIVKVVRITVHRTRLFLLTSRETVGDKMRNGVNEMFSQRTILGYCESEVVVVWSCLKSVLTETLTKSPPLSHSLLSLSLSHSAPFVWLMSPSDASTSFFCRLTSQALRTICGRPSVFRGLFYAPRIMWILFLNKCHY